MQQNPTQQTYTTTGAYPAPDMTIMSREMQFGFAGLCCVLLALLGWLVIKMLNVISENTKAFTELKASIDKLTDSLELADRIERASERR